ATSLTTVAQTALESLMAELGIPGHCTVIVAPLEDSADRWLKLRMADRECHYPDDLLQEVYCYVTGSVFLPTLTLKHLQRLPAEQWRLFLQLTLDSIGKLQPAHLFSLQAAAAYRTAISPHAQTPLPEATEIHAILSDVLNLRLSLADQALVARTLVDSAVNNLSRLDTTEAVIAALGPRPIEIHLPTTYWQQLMADISDSDKDLFRQLREGLWYELGLELPPLQFVPDDTLMPESFAFRLNHLLTLPRKGLAKGQWLVNNTPDHLRLQNIESTMALHPANRTVAAVVSTAERAKVQDSQLWSPLGYLTLALSESLRTQAGVFLNSNLASAQLDLLRQSCSLLVVDAENRYSIGILTQTFRHLLAETISLRNMRRILQALVDCDWVIADETELIVFDPRLTTPSIPPADWMQQPMVLASAIRTNLKQYISYKYARGQASLLVYLLEPKIEKSLTAPVASPDQTKPTASEEQIIAAVQKELEALPSVATIPAILTTTSVRAKLRQILAPGFPRLPILAYQELSSDVSVQAIARITLSEP
ncbi:MAG TPA: FHIPEP family type III secretion protein, partial [Blastocatellia bacterium]|nr:FHIPEP family type III secretion protein [Blastocatellia bacterium]